MLVGHDEQLVFLAKGAVARAAAEVAGEKADATVEAGGGIKSAARASTGIESPTLIGHADGVAAAQATTGRRAVVTGKALLTQGIQTRRACGQRGDFLLIPPRQVGLPHGDTVTDTVLAI